MKLSEYSTEELKRLVACEWRPGEYVQTDSRRHPVLACRERDDLALHCVSRYGTLGRMCDEVYIGPRRVTSFTDHTPLDPPETEMAAELRRRERPVVSNRTHGRRKAMMARMAAALLDEVDARLLRTGYGYNQDVVVGVTADGKVLFESPNNVELL